MKAGTMAQLQGWLARLGWPGLTGLLILGVALWGHWQVMPEMQAKLTKAIQAHGWAPSGQVKQR